MKHCELTIKTGEGKNGKPYYQLNIRQAYEGGKSFTNRIFLTEGQANDLADNYNIPILLKK